MQLPHAVSVVVVIVVVIVVTLAEVYCSNSGNAEERPPPNAHLS